MRAGIVTAGHPVNVATGAVYSRHRDFGVPGNIALYWERRYNTAQLNAPLGAHGIGWSARYFATLTRESDGYRLALPEGGTEVFVDPLGTIERGGTVRNLGTFQELWRRSDGYVVTRWGSGAQKPERLVFAPAPPSLPMRLVAIENEAGSALDIEYDGFGRVSRIAQRLERRALVIEYTEAGLVGTVAYDPWEGARIIVATFEYDRDRRLIAATNALGYTDRYEYDASGRIVREIRKDGTVYTFRYDRQGRCIRSSGLDRYDEKLFRYLDAVGWSEVTDSLGNTWRYQWLPTGQVITAVNPLGGEERTEYDQEGRIVATVLPGGETTRYRYDDAGNGVETIDPAGQSWLAAFDAGHQRISLTDPMGRVTRWHYDGIGHLIAVEPPGGGRFEYRWDERGNLTRVTTSRGVYQSFRYDPTGNLVEKIASDGQPTRYAMDPFGRIAEVVNPLGQRYRVEHDVLGNTTLIAYPDGSTERFAYDAGGNQVSATDRNGHVRTFRWGPCRRLLEATNANGGVVRYRWGTEPSRLEEVINEKGEAFRFIHDAVGRFTQQVGFDGRERSFAYDASGRVVRLQNGAGEAITFGWDARGRLTERRLPNGEVHRLTYDAAGDLIAAETPDRALQFERDAAGRIVREVQGQHAIESTYDVDGNRIRMTSDLGHAVEFDWDAGLRVRRLTLATGDVIALAVNEVGLESIRELPGELRLATEYDADGRPTLHRLAAPDGRPMSGAYSSTSRPIVQRSYEYAPNGTVLRVLDSRRGPADFRYDPQQQITRAALASAPAEAFVYDATGNITEITAGADTQALGYATGGRLESCDGTRYEYDGQGRLVKRIEQTADSGTAEWTFTWDALDQLRQVRTPDGAEWTYLYDVFGRRYSKRGPRSETEYVWDRDVIVHEITPRAKKPTSWIYVEPEPEPIAKLVGRELFVIASDQIGTPQELVGRDGRIAWSARSSVWGRDLGHQATRTDCPVRFPGQWFDPETGLHYNRFRYYDPRIGRFISQDPIAPHGRLNFYRYAPNPLNWIDLLGLDVCENREKGEDFKDGVKEKYEKAGFIVHEEVVVEVTTPDGQVRTRIDLVVKNPDTGKTYYIETKASDTAPYTPNQIDAGVGQGNGKLVGAAEMRSDREGLTPKGDNLPAGTRVQTVRPGDQLPGLKRGTTADPV